MSVKLKKMPWINFLKVRSIELMQHMSSILIHQDPTVSIQSIFNQDQELNQLKRWFTLNFILLILLVPREPRKLELQEANWKKLDISIRVFHISNKLFLLYLIEREITSHIDKQHWPTSWETQSVVTAKLSWLLTFTVSKDILKKPFQLWNSLPEWWK